MIRYIIRRLLWAVVLFIAVTLVTFVIFYLIPVDPARLAAGRAATPAEVQEVAHRLYLDKPIWQQYGHFLEQLVIHGNLGYSYANRQSVNDIIRSAAPITASLVIGAAILWMLIAIPIGVLSALRPRSLLDRTSMVFVLIGISVHPVWLALVGSYLLGYVPTSGHFLCFNFPSFTLLPIQGYCAFTGAAPGEQCGGPVDWFYHLLLPWSVFAFLYAAFYVRLVRSQVMEVQNEDYVRTARAKGAPERRVLDAARPAQRHAAGGHGLRHGRGAGAGWRRAAGVGVRPARPRATWRSSRSASSTTRSRWGWWCSPLWL